LDETQDFWLVSFAARGLLLGHQLQNTGTALQLVQGACRLLQLLQPSV